MITLSEHTIQTYLSVNGTKVIRVHAPSFPIVAPTTAGSSSNRHAFEKFTAMVKPSDFIVTAENQTNLNCIILSLSVLKIETRSARFLLQIACYLP